MKYFRVMSLVYGIVLIGVSASSAADQEADKAAVAKASASYTAAFNAGDAKALAAHWADDAIYINPFSGTQVEGREAITEEFTAILAGSKGTKLVVDIESIQLISPSVAVETGSAKLVSAEGEPQESTYTAIHVKRDGKWLLDRITEKDVPVVQSHYEHLKDLEWMIGNWVDQGEQDRIDTTCQWTKNKNFITRSFSVSIADRVEITGMQIIGWDPAAKQIRSWVFDSDGGFAEGRWTKHGKSWSISASGTQTDGQKSSAVNIITQVDGDQFKWQSVNRTVGGKLLPNIDEVVVVRSPGSE